MCALTPLWSSMPCSALAQVLYAELWSDWRIMQSVSWVYTVPRLLDCKILLARLWRCRVLTRDGMCRLDGSFTAVYIPGILGELGAETATGIKTWHRSTHSLILADIFCGSLCLTTTPTTLPQTVLISHGSPKQRHFPLCGA